MEGARIKENVENLENVENVQQATRSIEENLAQGVGRMQDKVQENVRRGVEQTRSMLASFTDQFGSFVQESPVLAISGAFAVGYLVAKVARAFK